MTDTDRTLDTAREESGEPQSAGAERLPLPGDGHMWVMVLGDLLIFGAYFVIFMVHRAMAPQEFLAAPTASEPRPRNSEYHCSADQFVVRCGSVRQIQHPLGQVDQGRTQGVVVDIGDQRVDHRAADRRGEHGRRDPGERIVAVPFIE